MRQAEIVVTTTPARRPLIERSWVRPGAHITAIGADAPGKQELDVGLVAAAHVRVCDLEAQSRDHGEFQHAHRAGMLDDLRPLGGILGGDAPGRTSDAEITIADLTGVAPQDVAIARAVLSAYLAKDKDR